VIDDLDDVTAQYHICCY